MKPDTIAEAAQLIVEASDVEELRQWLLLPEREAKWMAHFGLGLWIRNRWIHGEKAGLVLSYMGFPNLGEADEVSSLIAQDVWRHLNSLPPISRLQQASYCISESFPLYGNSEPLTWD